MIAHYLRRRRLAFTILYVHCSLLSLILYAFLGQVFFLSIYRLPQYAVIMGLWTLVLFTKMFFIQRIYNRKRRHLHRDVENAVYAERRLLIDSVDEFTQNRTESETVRLIELELRSDPRWTAYRKRTTRTAVLLISLTAAAIIGFGIGAALTVPQTRAKIVQVREFIQLTPEFDLPAYFIEKQPVEIDLSAQATNFDRLYLSVSNQLIMNDSGVYTLNEPYNAYPKIVFAVRAEKYGITRNLGSHTLTATSRLLPNKMRMAVGYSFKKEEYSGLQDLEMWQGGKLTVSGDFTKNVTNVSVTGSAGAATAMDGKNMSVSFYPSGTAQYSITVTAEDGDSYITPSFTVKTVRNDPPVITLIYPTADITLSYYDWVINAVFEAEDEQGVADVYCRVLVTNRDPLLSYDQEYDYSLDAGDERYYKDVFELNWDDIMILPNDCASVEIYCTDVFGAISETVGFFIISPDIFDLEEAKEEAVTTMRETISDITNSVSDLQRKLKEDNLSGADQSLETVETAMEALQEEAEALDQAYQSDAEMIADIKESMEKIKEITEFLKQDTEKLRDMISAMESGDYEYEDFDFDDLDMMDQLDMLQSLLDNLETFEEYSKMIDQLNILENVYESLKEETDPAEFDKALESYKEQLEQLGEMAPDSIKELTDQLIEEADNLEMSNEDSFTKSDALMEKLKEELQDEIGMFSQMQVQKKMDEISEIIAEFYLDQLILSASKELDLGTTSSPDQDNVDLFVTYINSYQSSFNKTIVKLEEALRGLIFEPYDSAKSTEPQYPDDYTNTDSLNSDVLAQAKESAETYEKKASASSTADQSVNPKDELESILEDAEELLDFVLTSLRDNTVTSVRSGTAILANYNAVIILYLIHINEGLEDAMQNQSQGQGSAKQTRMSMTDLMMMQAMMTSGLRKTLEQLEKNGQLTPELQELMDELAQLQKDIQENFQSMLDETGEGAISGGDQINKMMEDIIEALEGYNIEQETVEKSEELEEKLLDSIKSLKSKGVSEERQAESAHIYQPTAPEAVEAEDADQLDLDEVGGQTLTEYYRTLIEKYLESGD